MTQTVRLSLDSVRAQKFRSGLTILGIVIGITTVVTVASMLSGLREGIITLFRELGPDNVFVMRTTGAQEGPGTPAKERKRAVLRPEYADFIRQSCYSVRDIAITLLPQGSRSMTARVPGYESEDIMVMAHSPNMWRFRLKTSKRAVSSLRKRTTVRRMSS